VAPEERKTELVPLPWLMIGDGGEDSDLEEAVRAMQYMLEKRGFKCGWMGADGDFGQKTESALGKFQAAYGLEHDGICKGKDWAVLILGVKQHD
jgi:peptidoglycan hydrolase-like protein with peptidoglycan-binding domain